MKHLTIPVVLPVRLPRRGRPLFGAGCTDRPRRIRMPRQRCEAGTEACAQANELEATAYQALLNWTTNRETAAASRHW